MKAQPENKVENIKEAGARRLIERGVVYLEREMYGAALESFERAYGLNPESVDAAVHLAQELYMQGRSEESERVVKHGLEQGPNVELLRLQTAIVLDDARRRDEAVNVIERVKGECGDELTATLLEGHYEVERANGWRALELFRRVLDAQPGNDEASEGLARALNLVGIDLSEDGHNDEAVFVFRKAAALDPWWSAPYVNLGNCYSAMERIDLSRAAYRRGIDLEPDNPQAHFNLGRLLLEESDYDAAEAELLEVLEIDPDYPDAYGELGRVYSLKMKFKLAIVNYEKELERNPNCAPCMCNLAIAYICHGKAADGESMLKRAIEIEEDPFALYTLAGLYAMLNRDTDSILMLERAATFRPGWLCDYLRSDEKFDRIRSNPRFKAVISGLADASN